MDVRFSPLLIDKNGLIIEIDRTFTKKSMNRRARKAYWLTFGVIFRYMRLYAGSKIFGEKYWNRRIEKLHLQSAQKIKNGLLELQGLYVKVGQLISILSNVLPDAFREPLESLQDQIPPRDYSEIKQTIEREFGKPIDEVFASFEETPLAAASIGQTHRATIKDGTEVVVKIQHADIEEISKVDLKVIQNLVKIITRFFNIRGMDYLYSQVRLMIEEELDYVHEAKVMKVIGDNLRSEKGVRVPIVFDAYSTRKVITSAYSDGVKITDTAQLEEWGIDRTELAKRFIKMYCKMIFEDDIFHADPHPGNILVEQSGEIVLLDFGAVTQLNSEIKTGIPEMIIAFTRQDTLGMVQALRKMGFVGSGKDAEQLAMKLLDVGQDFLQNEVQIESLNLEGITIDPDSDIISKLFRVINLREIAKTFQIPKDWILLQRVMLLALGVSNQLDPKMNPAEVLRPYFRKMVIDQKGGITSFIIEAVKNQATTLLALPSELKKTLQKANKEGIEVNFEALSQQSKLISNTLRQLVFVLITIAAVYFANYYNEHHYSTAFTIAKWTGIVAFVLFLRITFRLTR